MKGVLRRPVASYVELGCECRPSMSRCPVATKLWATVETAPVAFGKRDEALVLYKAHMDQSWAEWLA